MSTRQSILYTLFIFFIALMLFDLGWWPQEQHRIGCQVQTFGCA